MDMPDSFAAYEFIRQTPRSRDEKTEGGEEFRIPVQEFVKNIKQDMTERATIINGRLSALRAVVPGQLRPAILAMGEW